MMTYNLISTITRLPLLVGCKEFPTDQQGMQLIKLINDFVNDNYKYSGQQLTEAFTMAVKRELFLDGKRVDPSTFGQYLSMNTVGQVLTAYKESKRDASARPKAYNPLQLEYKKKPIEPLEAFELIKRWCLEENKLPFAAPYKIAYKYLVEQGKIKEVNKDAISFGRRARANQDIDLETQACENWFKRNVVGG